MMEPDDFNRWVREARALGRRAGDDPMALRQAEMILGELKHSIRAAVPGLLDQGFSWADIGQELGITRQVAHRKYGPKRP